MKTKLKQLILPLICIVLAVLVFGAGASMIMQTDPELAPAPVSAVIPALTQADEAAPRLTAVELLPITGTTAPSIAFLLVTGLSLTTILALLVVRNLNVKNFCTTHADHLGGPTEAGGAELKFI